MYAGIYVMKLYWKPGAPLLSSLLPSVRACPLATFCKLRSRLIELRWKVIRISNKHIGVKSSGMLPCT